MYRPNFCAECGERVLRARWRAWTSRRFCVVCDARFRRRRVASTLFACVCLLAVGFAAGRALWRTPAPPLVVVRGGMAERAERKAEGAAEQAFGPDGTAGERPTDPLEAVSICGARTQKGTPCSRRVRGAGRCWQHRGKPAMLPPAKLLVPD